MSKKISQKENEKKPVVPGDIYVVSSDISSEQGEVLKCGSPVQVLQEPKEGRVAVKDFRGIQWDAGLWQLSKKAIQEMPEEAIPYYNQVLNITPYDIKVTFKLILAQYNAGNLEEVASLIKHLDQIMNENGTAEIPDNNKSDILQARNMLDTLRNILRDNLDEKI